MSNPQQPKSEGITEIAVRGFKSLAEERRFEIRPLTILAGANSSGKSSAIQPLLLLKQTLEATYDPGPLLLNGPNVRFTSAEQLLASSDAKSHKNFTVEIRKSADPIAMTFADPIAMTFVHRKRNKGFEIDNMRYGDVILKQDMSEEFIPESVIPQHMISAKENLQKTLHNSKNNEYIIQWDIVRERCFLIVQLSVKNKQTDLWMSSIFTTSGLGYDNHIRRVIHIPGLRGNPERTYKTTAVGDEFPGTFENYVASIINHWQSKGDSRLAQLSESLERLGLTWGVEARPLDDTQVELRVGRLKKRSATGKQDLVNISDVGFGVSQTLPVLVALLTAQPGQMVYIEQPEIHLHPRAQSAMAHILADAALRGVRVVVETHSSLLLRSIQTLVAEGYIPSQEVMLHWFKRRDDGVTDVTSTELDDSGAYGDWPEDFDDTILEVEGRYLDAVEAQQKTV
jgi:predicted ATPase